MRNNVLFLILSIISGIARTSFQSAVDSSQFIAQIVNYGANTISYEYFSSTFNIQSIGGALLLRLGVSELQLSAIYSSIAIFLYLKTFYNLAYTTCESDKNATQISIFLTLCCGIIYGFNYEVVIPPGQITFGPFAIIYTCYVLSQMILDSKKDIYLPTCILVHPFVGLYINLAYFAYCIMKKVRLSRAYLTYTLPAIAFIFYTHQSKTDVVTLLSHSNEILNLNLSKHRASVFTFNNLAIFIISLLALANEIYISKTNKKTVYSTIFILSFVSIALSLVYNLSNLNEFWQLVYVSMPSRNLNILLIFVIPIIMARLTYNYVLYITTILLISAFSFFSLLKVSHLSIAEGPHSYLPQIKFYIAVLASGTIYAIINRHTKSEISIKHNIFIDWLIGSLLIVTTVIYGSQFYERTSFYKNDVALLGAHNSKKTVLVAGSTGIAGEFMQSRIRNSIYFDTQLPSAFPYVSSDVKNEIENINKIYNHDFKDKERYRKVNQYCDDLSCAEVQKTFSQRTRQEWKALLDENNFSGILVPSTWYLNLNDCIDSKRWKFCKN